MVPSERAAAIVVNHYRWRYYVLGHKHLPVGEAAIYARLKEVRHAVCPAYTDMLRVYRAHLKSGGGAPVPTQG